MIYEIVNNPAESTQVEFCATSILSIHIFCHIYMYVHTRSECCLKVIQPTHRSQTGHNTTVAPSPVIAQQYSSTIFFSLRFYSLPGKIGGAVKIRYYLILFAFI